MLNDYRERAEDYCKDIFDNLEDMDPGSEASATAVANATRIVDNLIAIEQYESNVRKQEAELEAQAKKHEDEVKATKRETIIKYVVDVVKAGVSTAVTVGIGCAILKFEETGTITTRLGSWVINRLKTPQ